jgi:hypothetical protein
LATCPVVTLQSIFNLSIFTLFEVLLVAKIDGTLTYHEFIFSQDKIVVLSTEFGLRDRVLGASKIDAAFRIVEVADSAILIDVDRDFMKHVGSAELAILLLNIHIQFMARSAQQLESLNSCQTVPVESQQSETHLDDHILHGEVASQEHDVLWSCLIDLDDWLLFCLIAIFSLFGI